MLILNGREFPANLFKGFMNDLEAHDGFLPQKIGSQIVVEWREWSVTLAFSKHFTEIVTLGHEKLEDVCSWNMQMSFHKPNQPKN